MCNFLGCVSLWENALAQKRIRFYCTPFPLSHPLHFSRSLNSLPPLATVEVILDLSEPRTWLFYAMLLPSPRLGFRICDGNSISQALREIWYFIRQLSDIDRHRRMKWAKSGFLLPEAERIVSDGLLPNQITPPGITINCPSCFQGCTSF